MSARDPGLQAERTQLAWRRTILSATVVAVLAVRAALRDTDPVGATVVGTACCVLWLALAALGRARVREMRGARTPGQHPPTLGRGLAAATALCTVAMAVGGGWLVR
ncbi:DUF202 domain-containing protein [Streptomyces sp. NPDC002640]